MLAVPVYYEKDIAKQCKEIRQSWFLGRKKQYIVAPKCFTHGKGLCSISKVKVHEIAYTQ